MFDSIDYDETLTRKYISAALISSKSKRAEEDSNERLAQDEIDEMIRAAENFEAEDPEAHHGYSAFMAKRGEMKKKKLFEQIEKTVEYQETYYWDTRWRLDIRDNKFWCQYAMYLLNENRTDNFLSEWFAFAQSSTNEILLAMCKKS